MKKSLLIIFIVSLTLSAQAPFFGPRQDKGIIESAEIDEASGIASSRKNTDVLWIHNDSGDSARVFAVNTNGEHLGTYTIGNAVNRDWEDIAIGPGPQENTDYIYIGEVGDNSAQYDLKYIYRVPEPVVTAGQDPVYVSLGNSDIIKFRYPDGPRDAETIFVDPLTKDIYIVSKRENNVKVYLSVFPQSLTDTLIVDFVATLPLSQITGGDISPDGREILLKNYGTIYYWQRNLNQTVAEALNDNQFYTVSYTPEPQGEAVCWSYNSNGYYTVSEEVLNIPAHLYFYPRFSTNTDEENKEEGSGFYLDQNYPNPFNPETHIGFRLPGQSFVSLKIYNILGKEVAELINESYNPGQYKIIFHAGDLANGVYFYKLKTDNYTETKIMTLLK